MAVKKIGVSMIGNEKIKLLEEKINEIAEEISALGEDVGCEKKEQDYFFTGRPSTKFSNLFSKLQVKLFEWENKRRKRDCGNDLKKIKKYFDVTGYGELRYKYSIEVVNCAKKTITGYDKEKYPDISYIAYFTNQLNFFVSTETARESTEEVTSGSRTTIDRTIQKLLQLAKACNVSVDHPYFRDTVLSKFDISEKKLDRMLQRYSKNKVVEIDAPVQGGGGDNQQTIGDCIADTHNDIDEIIRQSHNANSIFLLLDSIETFWEARRSDTRERSSLVYTYWFLESVSGSDQKIDYASLAKKYKFIHKPLLSDFMETSELPAKQDLTKYDAEIVSKYSKFEPALLEYLQSDERLQLFVSLD